MTIFFKGLSATWRASLATVVTLSVSATVLGILLSVAMGDGSESEGQGLASSFSIITGISAILAARGIQMHSYGLRGNLIALLRDIGFSWNRIRFLALAEAFVLVLASFPLSLIMGWALAPAVGVYLRSVGVLHPHESASLTASGAAAALVAMLLIGTVCSFLAMRTFRRHESKAAKSAEATAGRVRRFLGNAGPATLLAGIAVLWTAAGYVISGIGLAFFGALLSFVVLPWVLARLLPGLAAFVANRLRPKHSVLHTALRWRASSKSIGVTYGALICILGGTIFGAHFYIADSAARNSWLSLLEGSAVAVTGGALALDADADTVTLTHVHGEVVPESSQDNVWMTSADAFRLLGPRIVAGDINASTEGIVVTHSIAKSYGIQLGDPGIVTNDGDRLPVTAFVELPNTVGSYFVVADRLPAELRTTGQRTTIVFPGGRPAETGAAAPGPVFSPAATWVSNIPAGQIVSNSGGAGISEAALLMAAPVLLGFTLMLSSRIISKDGHASSYAVLASLGASRSVRRKLAVTESILEVLLPGAVAGAIAVCVMLWADRLVIAGLGAQPSMVSVAAIPGVLLVLLCLADVATELIGRRSRSARN